VGDRPFREIEHTADIALWVRGAQLEDLFANAARGMAWLMATFDAHSTPLQHRLKLEAYDTESLLVGWLSELLYLGETTGRVFTGARFLELLPTRLTATVSGLSIVAHKRLIKAVTFSDLSVVETDHGYEVTIVFDV
jgi:SHS2 domain-containing protein